MSSALTTSRFPRALRAVAAFAVIVAVALSISGCGSGGSSSAASTRKPVDVGLLLSLTGGGNVYGPQQLKAARLAADQLNRQGGIDGRPLNLVVIDDRSDTATGRAAMRELIQRDNVAMVIGPTLSVVAVAADPIADQLQTPVLAVSNTAAGIVGGCSYACTWIWRDSLGEATAVPANISSFLLAHHTASVAILQTPNDVLGSTEAAIAQQGFGEAGARVAAHVPLPQSGSVTAAVRAALASHPGALFFATTYGASAAQAMRLARADGFHGAFLGGSTFNSSSTNIAAGPAGVGALSGSAWYAGNDFPANTSFVSAYKQAYDAAPDQFAAQAFTGVEIAGAALQRAGVSDSTVPIAAQRAAVQRALGGVALMTPLGPFRFTRDHDVSQIVWVDAMDGQGGSTLAGFCNPACSG